MANGENNGNGGRKWVNLSNVSVPIVAMLTVAGIMVAASDREYQLRAGIAANANACTALTEKTEKNAAKNERQDEELQAIGKTLLRLEYKVDSTNSKLDGLNKSLDEHKEVTGGNKRWPNGG